MTVFLPQAGKKSINLHDRQLFLQNSVDEYAIPLYLSREHATINQIYHV